MQVCATRNEQDRVSFIDSLFAGLPPDGGLYHPCQRLDLRAEIAALDSATSFQHVAETLSRALLGDELDAATLDAVVGAAFTFAPRLRWLGEELVLLELFHGPSCAFKDFGAAFLAALMEVLMARGVRRRAVVLVATSGDTGGAVARAFWQREGVEVVVLYPAGRISRLQEQQLAGLGDNVHALQVEGSFDDCQRMAKAALADHTLVASFGLVAANSISLGRLLPQSFYYVWAGVQLRSAGPPVFCVPSGNFGNLTAGVYAHRWGLPVAHFLAATNRNDVVPRFLAGDALRPRPSVATLSNAMDVGNPSNLERLLAIWRDDADALRAAVSGMAISDDETLQTIADVHRRYGQLVDPHTAVGIAALRRVRTQHGDRLSHAEDREAPPVVLATADPGKFPETVARATGHQPPLPASLREVLRRPKQATAVAADEQALPRFLEQRLGH